jgi:hypothetical protein
LDAIMNEAIWGRAKVRSRGLLIYAPVSVLAVARVVASASGGRQKVFQKS